MKGIVRTAAVATVSMAALLAAGAAQAGSFAIRSGQSAEGLGMAYAGVECLFESVRDPEAKAKHWNAAAGGFAAGMVMGALTKRMDISLVSGLGNGIMMGAVQYAGFGYVSDPHQMAMKVGGKWPTHYRESPELAALKDKYPEYKDL